MNEARFIPCFLNRQVLIILCSLGVSNTNIYSLLSEQVRELTCDFVKESKSAFVFLKSDFLERLQACIHLGTERFFQGLYSIVYRKKVKALIEKTHIFIRDGAVLMGVLDELDLWEEDQVFLQIQRSTEEKRVILGNFVLAKNPCLHPGDILRLKAVDSVAYRCRFDFVNVFVFSRKGSRPLPSIHSGSDLDGDLYWVS